MKKKFLPITANLFLLLMEAVAKTRKENTGVSAGQLLKMGMALPKEVLPVVHFLMQTA